MSTDESITQVTVREHLRKVIEGVSVDFGDDNLAEITNMTYIRKVYKLESEPKYIQRFTEEGNGTRSISVTGKIEDNQQLREYLESVILGTIALKGW